MFRPHGHPLLCAAAVCALGLSWFATKRHDIAAPPSAGGAQRSIAAACGHEIVCIWNSIDAGGLCRSHFSRSVSLPARWIEGRNRFLFHSVANKGASAGMVRYQADDVLVKNHFGEYERSTYACDIFVGSESPQVVRHEHRPGRVQHEG